MTNESAVGNLVSDFSTELIQLDRIWKSEVIVPYSLSYETAYNGMKSRLEAEKRSQEAMLSLALLGLSLMGGTAMTAVFGTTLARKLALDATLKVICERNMQQTFKVFAFLDKNAPWAGFAAGRLIDEAERYLSAKTAAAVRSMALDDPPLEELSTVVRSPLALKGSMEQFVARLLTRAQDIATEIENDPDSTPENKIKALKAMLASPLYSRPPTIQQKNLAETIELGFYMQMLLNSDYLYEMWIPMLTGQPEVVSRKPITEQPGSRSYPRPAKPTFGQRSWQEVRIREVGSVIRDRIETLYTQLGLGREFFEASWYERKTTHAALAKAQMTLDELSKRQKRVPIPPPKVA